MVHHFDNIASYIMSGSSISVILFSAYSNIEQNLRIAGLIIGAIVGLLTIAKLIMDLRKGSK